MILEEKYMSVLLFWFAENYGRLDPLNKKIKVAFILFGIIYLAELWVFLKYV